MRDIAKERVKIRRARRQHIRQKIQGTESLPRLCVRRSLNHFYGQLVDDEKGITLGSSSSVVKDTKILLKGKTKVEASFILGKQLGEIAKSKGINEIVFDRSGYLYHGRVKSFADGAREAGLNF